MSSDFYTYEELLARAWSKLPKKRIHRERWQPPKPEVMISGKRTFIQNFNQICDYLNRDPKHLMRFILRELAAPGSIEGNMLVIQGEYSPQTINSILQRYIRIFVRCPVCKQPDTFLVKEKRMYFLVCAACGAKCSIPPIL